MPPAAARGGSPGRGSSCRRRQPLNVEGQAVDPSEPVLIGGGHALHRLAQDLVLERLLAEQALQLTDLLMRRTQLGGRNHLLAGAGGGQRAPRYQPAPGEELVARDAMTPRDERDRVAGQIRLFDDRTFSSVDQRRRRCTDVITSTRSALAALRRNQS